MAGLQKKVLVIDIGYRYTKLGVSGDAHPRCILPTTFRDPLCSSVKNVLDYRTEEELFKNLVAFIHSLYFKKILISPKDTKVIVIDSLLSPIVVRETLAKVLFCHLQVASLLMVPSHMVSLYTLGVPSALVLDIGHQEAVIVPVCEGYPMLNATESQPLAGDAIENNLRTLLVDQYKESNSVKAAVIEKLPVKIIEDIKVRLCFVTTLKRVNMMEAGEEVKPPPSVDYNLAGTDQITISGKVRETACEVLFRLDADEISLTTMILNCLLKCPVDMRKELAKNILLIGGTASLPGIKARILDELRHHIKTPKYKDKLFVTDFRMHSSPSCENYTAWLGGALIGVTEMINRYSISKEDYKREKDMPDWANLKYNIR